MNDLANHDAYGRLIEPATLKMQRLLPGPIERVWAYLTESDKRRLWLAAGDMDLKVGAPFKLTWRNDELSDPPSKRPEGFGEEHSLDTVITDIDPPRLLAYEFGDAGHVKFELKEKGGKVLLTLTHTRLPNRNTKLMVSAGWHAHLDVLAARLTGDKPGPFWDRWVGLRSDYDRLIPE